MNRKVISARTRRELTYTDPLCGRTVTLPKDFAFRFCYFVYHGNAFMHILVYGKDTRIETPFDDPGYDEGGAYDDDDEFVPASAVCVATRGNLDLHGGSVYHLLSVAVSNLMSLAAKNFETYREERQEYDYILQNGGTITGELVEYSGIESWEGDY